MRCENGYRPTAAERWQAREVLARRKAGEAPAPKETAKQRKVREARERRQKEDDARRAREADDLAHFVAPTPEEMERLRAEFPQFHRSRHG
jgi:hypothetical protein